MIDLIKWPALLVKGDKVTPDQAAAIILKTSLAVPEFSWTTNDKDLGSRAAALFDIPPEPDYPGPLAETRPKPSAARQRKAMDAYRKACDRRCAAIDKLKERLNLVQLQYLHNDQVCSCYVGGPHGWCHWDGKIEANSFNIGKWPHADEVFEEWKAIAEVFPFLRLTCQLCNHEAGYPREGQINGPVVRYEVADGKVEVFQEDPAQDFYITPPQPPDITPLLNHKEWSVTIPQLKQKIISVWGQDYPKYEE